MKRLTYPVLALALAVCGFAWGSAVAADEVSRSYRQRAEGRMIPRLKEYFERYGEAEIGIFVYLCPPQRECNNLLHRVQGRRRRIPRLRRRIRMRDYRTMGRYGSPGTAAMLSAEIIKRKLQL